MRDGSATRKKIERCALALFVEKGVSATTIKDIAGKAQIAEGAMYRHFKSKDELAQFLFTHYYQQVASQLKADADSVNTIQEKLSVMVKFFCQHYDQDPVLFNYLLLVQHTQIQTMEDKEMHVHNYLVALFNDAIKNKTVHSTDPYLLASIVLGIVLQAAISRVYGRIQRPLSDDADVLVKAIMGAINAL